VWSVFFFVAGWEWRMHHQCTTKQKQHGTDAIDANRLLAVTKDRLWSKDDPSA
jgi:hypothetical protein